MNKKKMAIIVLALVALIGGTLIITRSIVKKEQANDSTQNPVLLKKEPSNLFGQEVSSDGAKKVLEVSGTLETIGEKTITIKNAETGAVVVNVTGATPVMLTSNSNKPTIGQMADLKVGDAVRVNYDEATKNVTMIVVFRAQTATKK